MTGRERLILIGCLLQGAMGSDWEALMPDNIEVLSRSCVLIPCRFRVISEYENDVIAGGNGIWGKGQMRRIVFNSSRAPQLNEINGTLIGDLQMKNCSTILDNFLSSSDDNYFFRVEFRKLKYNFAESVRLNVRVSPQKPSLTAEEMEVTEGTPVNLSCSAAAPCPKLPPTLTWTPSLGNSVDQLQDKEDQTKYVSSFLTFTASHLHHGQKITCSALYKLQQGDSQEISKTSLTLTVLYMPQISGSGSCNRTAAQISCSCETHGNPSPSMEWHVSGLWVTNSTDRVIREERLGNTGLRSSLTMNHSQGVTPTLLCRSTNTVGSSSLQLYVPPLKSDMPQISGSGSCNRTAAQISCSCETHGNPSPSMEWHVSGLRVINSTDRVIREERMGNTSLRSSLTMYDTKGVTPTLLCLSTNTVGFSSLQLCVPSPPLRRPQADHSYPGPMLIGVLVGALMISLLWCVVLFLIQKKSRMFKKNCANNLQEALTRNAMEKQTNPAPVRGEPEPSSGPPLTSIEDLYANQFMVVRKSSEQQGQDVADSPRQIPTRTQKQAGEDTLHYASVKFIARKID